MASRRAMKSAASTGKRPQKTTGWAGLKPGRASGVPRRSVVMVSPTRVSRTCLMLAVRKPISPGPRLSAGSMPGRKVPMRSTG